MVDTGLNRDISAPSFTVPAPVGGWNDATDLFRLPPQDALLSDNFIPGTQVSTLREGYASHGTGMGSSPIPSMFEYAKQDGTRALIVGTNANLYNATAAGAATSIGSGFSSNEWSAVNFNNVPVLCNGADSVRNWNGSTLSTPSITNVTSADLISVSAFKESLYFVEKDSASIWYLPTGQVAGAATELNLQSILKRGGKVLFAGSWSRDTGSGGQDLFTVVSDTGEVLVYSGTDPTDFALFGRYYLPPPLGRRAFIEYGSDLLILTIRGIFPVSSVLNGNEEVEQRFNQLSYKIQNTFRKAAKFFGISWDWSGLLFPTDSLLIVNIPIDEDQTYHQYVMNTDTGAWCRLKGINATSFAVVDNVLYFGGIDGVVYKYGQGILSDAGNNIEYEIKGAYIFGPEGGEVVEKIFMMAKPILLTSAAFSVSLLTDTDARNSFSSSDLSVSGPSGASWGSADWDDAFWAEDSISIQEWVAIEEMGRSLSIGLKGAIKDASITLAGYFVTYETGGAY